MMRAPDRATKMLKAIRTRDKNVLAGILGKTAAMSEIDEDYYSVLYGLATKKDANVRDLKFGLDAGAANCSFFKTMTVRLFTAVMHNNDTSHAAMKTVSAYLPKADKPKIFERCLTALFKRAVWMGVMDDAPSGHAASFLIKSGTNPKGIVFRETFEIMSHKDKSEESRKRADIHLKRLNRFEADTRR